MSSAQLRMSAKAQALKANTTSPPTPKDVVKLLTEDNLKFAGGKWQGHEDLGLVRSSSVPVVLSASWVVSLSSR